MANPTTALPYTTTSPATDPVSYGEYVVNDPYREGWTPHEGNTAVRILYCGWSDRRNFRIAMLGDHFWGDGSDLGPVGQLTRYGPEVHPEDVGLQQGPDPFQCRYVVAMELIRAGSVAVDSPLADSFQTYLENTLDASGIQTEDPTKIDFGKSPDGLAYFKVTYGQLRYRVIDGTTLQAGGNEINRYVEVWSEPSIANRQIPGQAFKWVDDPTIPIPTPQIKPEHLTVWFFKWHWVPLFDPTTNIGDRIPLPIDANWKATVGKVNEQQSTMPQLASFTPQTLLVIAPRIERVTLPSGELAAHITVPMQERVTGWNKQFYKKLEDYRPFSVDGTLNKETAAGLNNFLFALGDPQAMFAWNS